MNVSLPINAHGEAGMTRLLENTGKKLSSSGVCERYDNINRRTLGRWMNDPDMGFPAPITINSKHYWNVADLEAFERRSVLTRGRAA